MSRQRATIAGAGLAVVVVVVLAVVLLGGASAPADRADALVPADARVYVHLSTDPDRDQDARVLELLQRFPAVTALRRRAESAVGAFDFKRDLRSWLGKEAAIAATERGTLLVLAVEKEPTAQGVLTRVAGARPAGRHAGVVVRRFGPTAAAFTGGFLVIGPEALVKQSIDLEQGRGRSLSKDKTYARAAELRPDDRSIDAWTDGSGAALVLPLRLAEVVGGWPVSASVIPNDRGLRLSVRRFGGASPGADFDPKLIDSVPDDALAYVGVRSPRTLGPLLPDAVGDAAAGLKKGLAPLLEVLDGGSALSITPATPEPVVTLSARTSDPAAAREALAGLQGIIAGLLTGSEDLTGQVPTFEELDLGDGLDGFRLRLAGGGELVYVVTGRTVIVSNSSDGVRRAARPSESLRDTEDFGAAVDGVPGTAQALAFLDASKLLALGDEAGLDASPTYRAVRNDLRKVRALGAVVRRRGNDTTVELNFLIP